MKAVPDGFTEWVSEPGARYHRRIFANGGKIRGRPVRVRNSIGPPRLDAQIGLGLGPRREKRVVPVLSPHPWDRRIGTRTQLWQVRENENGWANSCLFVFLPASPCCFPRRPSTRVWSKREWPVHSVIAVVRIGTFHPDIPLGNRFSPAGRSWALSSRPGNARISTSRIGNMAGTRLRTAAEQKAADLVLETTPLGPIRDPQPSGASDWIANTQNYQQRPRSSRVG